MENLQKVNEFSICFVENILIVCYFSESKIRIVGLLEFI